MWLFTSIGFVSVVRSKSNPRRVVVRARCREDIDRFVAAYRRHFPRARKVEAIRTPLADYRYRVELPKASFAELVRRLVEAINYTNFKNSVHGDPARDSAYMRCWTAMHAFQEAKEAPQRKRAPAWWEEIDQDSRPPRGGERR
jgi:hypothetical protein